MSVQLQAYYPPASFSQKKGRGGGGEGGELNITVVDARLPPRKNPTTHCAGLTTHGDFLAATSNCLPSKYGFQFASSSACRIKKKIVSQSSA